VQGSGPNGTPALESLIDILTGRLKGQGAPAHQAWLPPLREPASLGHLLGPLVTTAD
jgi:S-DNA-T family DNA segregation ATPase FtsK/SpoIIIE